VRTIVISSEDFEMLRELQYEPPRKAHAIFSATEADGVWPFVTFGVTPDEQRVKISGIEDFALLDEIVDEFLAFRPEGGRFFIDRNGAYVKVPEDPGPMFLRFKFRN
jgi:hypothetical protein